MITIRLNLKRTTGKTTTVRAIIRDGQKYTVSTGVKVEIDDWDRKRERCRKNESANKDLDNIRKTIREFWEKHKRAPTIAEIKKPVKGKSIQTAIVEHGAKIVASKGKPNTAKAYNTLASNLINYQTEKNRKEQSIEDITEDYLMEFQKWMNGKMFSNGHAGKMMRTLRTVIRGKIDGKQWAEVKPVQMKPKDTIYLTTEEINLIENVQLPTRLDKTRDLFLIGCYTGQRYSDWTKIRSNSMQTVHGQTIISITQTKTDNTTTLPINQKLKSILAKYNEKPPIISNQKLNKYIREVARIAGINQIITAKEYRGQQEIERTCEKWEMVTSHTARRSFATNALLAGIPITEIMKLGGWKSITAFSTYIRTTEIETALMYANHQFFK